MVIFKNFNLCLLHRYIDLFVWKYVKSPFYSRKKKIYIYTYILSLENASVQIEGDAIEFAVRNNIYRDSCVSGIIICLTINLFSLTVPLAFPALKRNSFREGLRFVFIIFTAVCCVLFFFWRTNDRSTVIIHNNHNVFTSFRIRTLKYI